MFSRIQTNAAGFDTELWKAATMFVKSETELRRTVANIKKMNAELRTLNFKKTQPIFTNPLICLPATVLLIASAVRWFLKAKP